MNRRAIPLLAALGVAGACLLALQPKQNAEADHAPADRPIQRAVTTSHAAGLPAPALGVIRADETPAGAQAPYIPGQVMVAPASGERLEDIAADHGAVVIREIHRSGYGVLQTSGDGAALLDGLRSDSRIRDVAPHAAIVGAGKGQGQDDPPEDAPPEDDTAAATVDSILWHRDAANIPSDFEHDLTAIVVAVLDTGVAYETHSDDDHDYVQAPGLTGAAVVAPWDFVNGDEHANDDHQHGTHIASTILSRGALPGVAPGASLMPIKVLNGKNQGYELDLVEGIHHAVANGADVINLSLSFSKGYAPSLALLDALDAAHASGVVMIGASGNEAVAEVTWPAASPLVLAVGASCKSMENNYEPAPYSNMGVMMDVMAPGGCLDRDENSDGVLDGIAAETIALGDPSQIGDWLYAGTSQAAAVVSGAAAHLLAAGAQPRDIPWLLQLNSMDHLGLDGFSHGFGGGFIDIGSAVHDAAYSYEDSDGREFHVAVLPWLADNGDGTVTPRARLTVLNEALEPAEDITVLARLHGDTDGWLQCTIKRGGICEVAGPAADSQGGAAALGWRFTVDGVVVQNEVVFRPQRLMFASESLDALAEVISADPELRDAMLVLRWASGDDVNLGSVAESYTVVDSGSGLSTSPLGLVFTPPTLNVASEQEISLDGTGLSTSPLGMRLLSLDGSGLSTSPLGFSLLSIDAFSGTGLSTSPLGRRTYSTLDGTGLSTSPLGFAPMLMGSGTIATTLDTSEMALQQLVDEGAWSTMDGEQGATLLTSTQIVETGPAPLNSGSGSIGAIPL